MLVALPRLVCGHRIGDDDALPVAEVVLGLHDRGDLCGGVDRPVEGEGALTQPEAGEDVGAEADHRNAQRFEPLECRGDVEHRLDARADDGDRGDCESAQVSRFVEALAGSAVHSPEAAGGENPHAGQGGEVAGSRDSGGGALSRGCDDRQVSDGCLGEVVLGDTAHTLGVETDLWHSIEHSDCRWSHTLIAQNLLELERGLVVAGARQSVRDDRRLKGDDGAMGGECLGNFCGDSERCRHRL